MSLSIITAHILKHKNHWILVVNASYDKFLLTTVCNGRNVTEMKLRNEINRVYMINDSGEIVGQINFMDIGENRVMIKKLSCDCDVDASECLDVLFHETVKRLYRDQNKVYLVHPLAIEWFANHSEYQDLIWKQKK